MSMADIEQKKEAFGRLLTIMDDLREKCPWDRKQTFESLRKLTIEEMYELADAILDQDLVGIEEEVGDLMLHMAFYAKLGEEAGAFDMATLIQKECNKLVDRHPHVYGDLDVKDDEEVKRNWEQLKLQEKGKKSVLDGVPKRLPAITKAYRMQEKTATVGFEWDDVADVWKKVEEEQQELQEALTSGDQKHIEEEFGDLLFALVNYARFIDVDPEAALERTNQKFKRRFEYIEDKSTKPLAQLSLAEMDKLWNDAKSPPA
jgi:XTP/dITP diphosphohydrolase